MKKTAVFLSSAANRAGFLTSEKIQIAVVGKSNVGKSSFLNFLAGDGKLARTSKDPGRTRLINYFLFGDSVILTDLPGYGYAKVSFQEKKMWASLMETYFREEPMLRHVLFLVDLRHEPTADDKTMFRFLTERNLPFTVIATKADKLKRYEIPLRVRSIANTFCLGEKNVIPVSVPEKRNRDLVWERLEQIYCNETNPAASADEVVEAPACAEES